MKGNKRLQSIKKRLLTAFLFVSFYIVCFTVYNYFANERLVSMSESLVNEEVEAKMDLVRDICSLGRDAREDANIKVRQPINEVILAKEAKDVIGDLDSIIKAFLGALGGGIFALIVFFIKIELRKIKVFNTNRRDGVARFSRMNYDSKLQNMSWFCYKPVNTLSKTSMTT